MVAQTLTLRRVHDEECTNAGDTNNERNKYLKECCENHTLLCLRERFCGETLLDDILVEAPVANVCKPESTEDKHDARAVEVWV